MTDKKKPLLKGLFLRSIDDGKKQVRRQLSGVMERQIVRCAVACFLPANCGALYAFTDLHQAKIAAR
jgi:hypothetical protein